MESILQEWEDHAFAIQPESGSMNKKELRDHAQMILLDIADGIERNKSKRFREERSRGLHPLLGKALKSSIEHGITRHGFGFNINDVLSEYRALRSSVMRLWAESEQEESDNVEISLFNEELDGVIMKSVEAFAAESDKQRRLLEKVITASPDHCYLLNDNGRFIYANTSMLKDLGIANPALMGRTHHDLPLPGSETLYHEAMKVIATGEDCRGEMSYSLPSGRDRIYEYIYTPIFDDQQAIEGVAALERDVTDHKELIKALHRSNEALELYAHILSHDLQAPLRSVAGFLDLLKRRYDNKFDEKGQHYIERTVASIHHMKNLIDSLLSMSRLTSRPLQRQESNFNRLIEIVLNNLESILHEKHATVLYPDLPTVAVDFAQIQILFQNLIINAVKYNESSKPKVEIGYRKKKNEYEFFVKDNGIGIPGEFHERIFMVFQRLHTTEEYEGIGLGLTTCKKIVERHGGTIWVESSPGEGTAFYFTLPSEK